MQELTQHNENMQLMSAKVFSEKERQRGGMDGRKKNSTGSREAWTC